MHHEADDEAPEHGEHEAPRRSPAPATSGVLPAARARTRARKAARRSAAVGPGDGARARAGGPARSGAGGIRRLTRLARGASSARARRRFRGAASEPPRIWPGELTGVGLATPASNAETSLETLRARRGRGGVDASLTVVSSPPTSMRKLLAAAVARPIHCARSVTRRATRATRIRSSSGTRSSSIAPLAKRSASLFAPWSTAAMGAPVTEADLADSILRRVGGHPHDRIPGGPVEVRKE